MIILISRISNIITNMIIIIVFNVINMSGQSTPYSKGFLGIKAKAGEGQYPSPLLCVEKQSAGDILHLTNVKQKVNTLLIKFNDL